MERLEDAARKGSVVYVFDNYIYKSNSAGRNGTNYLICTNRLCRIRARVSNNNVVVSGDHAHPPEGDKIKKLRILKDLRKSAKEHKTTNMRQIFDKVCER